MAFAAGQRRRAGVTWRHRYKRVTETDKQSVPRYGRRGPSRQGCRFASCRTGYVARRAPSPSEGRHEPASKASRAMDGAGRAGRDAVLRPAERVMSPDAHPHLQKGDMNRRAKRPAPWTARAEPAGMPFLRLCERVMSPDVLLVNLRPMLHTASRVRSAPATPPSRR